jgi:hypothetical protein
VLAQRAASEGLRWTRAVGDQSDPIPVKDNEQAWMEHVYRPTRAIEDQPGHTLRRNCVSPVRGRKTSKLGGSIYRRLVDTWEEDLHVNQICIKKVECTNLVFVLTYGRVGGRRGVDQIQSATIILPQLGHSCVRSRVVKNSRCDVLSTTSIFNGSSRMVPAVQKEMIGGQGDVTLRRFS